MNESLVDAPSPFRADGSCVVTKVEEGAMEFLFIKLDEASDSIRGAPLYAATF